jgi:hypothetical protein
MNRDIAPMFLTIFQVRLVAGCRCTENIAAQAALLSGAAGPPGGNHRLPSLLTNQQVSPDD